MYIYFLIQSHKDGMGLHPFNIYVPLLYLHCPSIVNCRCYVSIAILFGGAEGALEPL